MTKTKINVNIIGAMTDLAINKLDEQIGELRGKSHDECACCIFRDVCKNGNICGIQTEVIVCPSINAIIEKRSLLTKWFMDLDNMNLDN